MSLWKEFDQDDDDIHLNEAEAVRLKTVLAAVVTNKGGQVDVRALDIQGTRPREA